MKKIRALLPTPFFVVAVLAGFLAYFAAQTPPQPRNKPDSVFGQDQTDTARKADDALETPKPTRPNNGAAIANATARPLFAKGREFSSPVDVTPEATMASTPPTQSTEPAPSVQQTFTPPPLRYSGYVEDTEPRALVQVHPSNQEIWLRVDDDIEGWTVVEISQGAIILIHKDEQHVVGFNQ